MKEEDLEHTTYTGHTLSDAIASALDRWWLVLLILFGLVFILGIPS